MAVLLCVGVFCVCVLCLCLSVCVYECVVDTAWLCWVNLSRLDWFLYNLVLLGWTDAFVRMALLSSSPYGDMRVCWCICEDLLVAQLNCPPCNSLHLCKTELHDKNER